MYRTVVTYSVSTAFNVIILACVQCGDAKRSEMLEKHHWPTVFTYSVSTASNVIILACVRMWWCKRREMLVEKPLIGQTVIAPYMKDAKYDILLYNEIYRYEILQRRIVGAVASSYEISAR